jgi:molybdopterin biosynthesis enzyme MoaB
MRAVNPLGRLSRNIAGIRGRALILNTPGSPGGAVEMLEAVIDVLPHVVELMAGVADSHPGGWGSDH